LFVARQDSLAWEAERSERPKIHVAFELLNLQAISRERKVKKGAEHVGPDDLPMVQLDGPTTQVGFSGKGRRHHDAAPEAALHTDGRERPASAPTCADTTPLSGLGSGVY
jgi:hypothetical protein